MTHHKASSILEEQVVHDLRFGLSRVDRLLVELGCDGVTQSIDPGLRVPEVCAFKLPNPQELRPGFGRDFGQRFTLQEILVQLLVLVLELRSETLRQVHFSH